jgi:hypothetical protein
VIQFPSDRPDRDQKHVAGSQRAADKQIARNTRKAARRAQSTPSQRHLTTEPVEARREERPGCMMSMPDKMLYVFAFGCMALAIVAALIGGAR